MKLGPSDFDLLGLEWCDTVYVDSCLPFGTRHTMQMFQTLSHAVHFGMRSRGYGIINYVDDFVGVGAPSMAKASFDVLLALLCRLGLDISQKKLVPPGTKAVSRLIQYRC